MMEAVILYDTDYEMGILNMAQKMEKNAEDSEIERLLDIADSFMEL